MSEHSPLPTVLFQAEDCLAALARGSAALMNAEHWADGVDRLLAEIGPVAGASRVWVFQLLEIQPDAVIQDYIFEWASEECYRQLYQRRFRFFSSSVLAPEYCQLVEERQAGKCHDFCVSSMQNSPFKRHLESQAILSMATVPIFVNGRWWGVLGIDDCKRDISWKGSGLDLLKTTGQLISAAIYRYQLGHRSRQVELFHKVTDCGVWEASLRNGRVWCSEGLKKALGYPDSYPRVPLRRLVARLHPNDRLLLWKKLRIAISGSEVSQFRLDARVQFSQKKWIWQEIIAELRHNEQGTPVALAGILIDISRRKQNEEKANFASERDALTGALNRRGLDRYIEEYPRGTAKHLILFDIDHFKQVNDTYGHLVGDVLLVSLVERIHSELRTHDYLVRLGGEEFAVLTPNMQDDQAASLAERLRLRVAGTPFYIEVPDQNRPLSISITISLGVARQSLEEIDALIPLMAEADQALYAAKHAGRNLAVVYDAMDTAPQGKHFVR